VADSYSSFAEQILRSADLEGKLLPPPAGLVDDAGSAPWHLPDLPARPSELRWKARGEPFRFPARIDSDTDRGHLLHHMANHELLAVELMALALLKFPDAPRAFRKGLLATLVEEQEHTRLYLEQMRRCGVAFGTLPVSGYFWRIVSPMAAPIDYVTRLSLTFEQANLDYSKAYAALFAKLGDPETASLFERIHTDEIGHVGYGLHWFRKWKQAEASDWDAFRAQLPPDIPPARARGVGFDRAGRERAGLDPTFIQQIEVEPPRPTHPVTAHWVNPGPDSGAPLPARLRDTLALLPAAWMREGELLLIRSRPRTRWLEFLARHELPIPHLLDPDSPAAPGPVAHLDPWAWTPAAIALEQRLGSRHPRAPRDPEALARLFSKAAAIPLLSACADALGIRGPGAEPGCVIADPAQLRAQLDRFRALGFDQCVAKRLLGCAGRGHRRIDTRSPGPELARLDAQCATEGPFLLEPWFDRRFDFSLHFDVTPDGVRFVGTTEMRNTRAGTWRASIAQPTLAHATPFARFFHTGRPSLLQRLAAALAPLLHAAFEGTGYRGPAGIDAFLFARSDGTLGCRPVVELNPRHTMGRAVIDAMRRCGSGRAGRIRFLPATIAAATARVERDPSGGISRGILPFGDPEDEVSPVPVLELAPAVEDLPDAEETAGRHGA